MSHYSPRCIRAALLSTVLTIAGSWAANAAAPPDTLYIQDNNPASGQNSVLGFHRNVDGSLERLPGSPFLTGGTGFAVPLSAPPGPFDGQNIMAADPEGGIIYVPNGGSDSISALRMAFDGMLKPVEDSPFAITGDTPEALSLRGQTLVIVNNGTDPNQANRGINPSYITAFTDVRGRVSEIKSATVSLTANSLPTQALSSAGTPLVFTNEFGAATISEYFLDFSGHLYRLGSQPGPVLGGATTPAATLGQDLNPLSPYLYVGVPGASQIAVYSIGLSTETFVGSVATTNGSAASPAGSGNTPCWVHVRRDGRYLYSSNTGSSSISVFDLRDPAAPVVVQTQLLNKVHGASFDFEFSPDGLFMYVIEGATAASEAASPGSGNQVHILSVNQVDGRVSEINASPVNLGVAGHRVQGALVF
jgi:DNA-binding beta-propeller fold protein YncE